MTKKKKKSRAREQMVCFMVGKENLSLWLHYQIMICIFTVEMNNKNWNVGEMCRTKISGVRLL